MTATTSAFASPDAPLTCATCDTQIAPALLACPACGWLVHGAALGTLAAEAQAAETAGDHTSAVARWRAVLERLPPGSRQHTEVARRLAAASDRLPSALAAPKPGGRAGRILGALGVVGLVLWKAKVVVLLLLGKGKLLLLGLTKVSTVFSMLAAFGIYWAIHGWKFAAGLLISIYVHEMGHVAALRRYGIAASAPMFIPGLGAFIRLKSHPATAREDAMTGLAGPVWGAIAALAFLAGAKLGGGPSWEAIARVGAWINLFNLLPIWQLDGGRAFTALARRERIWLAGSLLALWAVTQNSMCLLVALVAGARLFQNDRPARSEPGVLPLFLALAAFLSYLGRF